MSIVSMVPISRQLIALITLRKCESRSCWITAASSAEAETGVDLGVSMLEGKVLTQKSL
jgi:hypothetical protein